MCSGLSVVLPYTLMIDDTLIVHDYVVFLLRFVLFEKRANTLDYIFPSLASSATHVQGVGNYGIVL